MRRCAQCQVDYPDALDVCPTDGAPLPRSTADSMPVVDPLIGETIDGRYAVEAVLGEGGMGMVYAGRHVIIDKRVAIKVLRKEVATDESTAERFLAEAKAASKIGQQNIVDITDFGKLADGQAYFVMEFLDGATLGKLMSYAGPLPPARAVAITLQIGRGLLAAHAKGITHRDLKPENVFVLDRDGIADTIKIVDFGIARDTSTKKRLTVAGMVMGTPEYMAPEQASGLETDHRADQYALGCILYEMVTGVTPFRGENPMQTLTKHVFDPVVPPSERRRDLVIPAPLEEVIMRALEKKRDDRYADIDEMMRALQALEPSLRGIVVPQSAQGASVKGPPTAFADEALRDIVERPRRRLLILLGVVVVLAAAGAGALLRPKPVVMPITPPPVAPIVKKAAPPPPVSKPAAASVKVVLRSEPPGAEVFLRDERIGATPITTTQPRSETEPLSFVFRKPGFRELVRAVPAITDSDVEVALFREPTISKPTGKPVGKPGVTLKPDTKPEGRDETPKNTHPPVAEKPARNPELRNPFDVGK